MKTYELLIKIKAECKSDALERMDDIDKHSEIESFELFEGWC